MEIGAKVTSKGQITLPKAVRDSLDLKPGDRVFFRIFEGKAELAKIPDFFELAGSIPVPASKRGASWRRISEEAHAAWARESLDDHS
ncbi:MAG: AbrB/MazE/SpoVT family DNA-binding domain-containing protein [Actinomycetota bacterium]